MENDKELKDLLQGHFSQYEAEPDRDIWAEVAAGLGQKPRRAAIPWWQYGVAVAASVLLLLGAIWMLQDPATVPPRQMVEQDETGNIPLPAPAPQQLTQSPGGDEEIPRQQRLTSDTALQQRRPIQKLASSPTMPATQTEAPIVSVNSATEAPKTPMLTQIGRVNVNVPASELAPERTHGSLAAIAQVQEPVLQPQRIEARPLRGGQRNELDLDELTLASAISFASDELGKWAKSPVEIYTERTPEREVRTYELDILNLRITRKVYRKSKN